jgi:hypothetical protein
VFVLQLLGAVRPTTRAATCLLLRDFQGQFPDLRLDAPQTLSCVLAVGERREITVDNPQIS